jgi:hypothetical protein
MQHWIWPQLIARRSPPFDNGAQLIPQSAGRLNTS